MEGLSPVFPRFTNETNQSQPELGVAAAFVVLCIDLGAPPILIPIGFDGESARR